MRKTLILAAAALALPFAASAQPVQQPGFYVQGDVGLANIKVDNGEEFKLKNTAKEIKQSYKDSKFMPRVSVGYDFGNNVRTALDYTHYSKIKDSVKDGDTEMSADAKVRSLGASVIYDIPVDWAVRPYVGARLGLNRIKSSASAKDTTDSYSASESKTTVGVGAMVGVGYKINQNVALDAGYRFNHIESDVNAHEASVGVRYSF